MASIHFKARPVGANGVLRRFMFAAAHLGRNLLDAQRELGKRAEVVFGAHVPIRSGRALRGISSDSAGGTVTVTDYARNPQSGYDYIGVTRFGHGIIRPKGREFAAEVIATKLRRGGETLTHGYDSFTSHAALRFSIGGRIVYAAYVRAWKPASDWVEDAQPEIQTEAQVVATRLGQTVVAHF